MVGPRWASEEWRGKGTLLGTAGSGSRGGSSVGGKGGKGGAGGERGRRPAMLRVRLARVERR